MLKLSAKFECVFDLLYIAMFCYKLRRFRKALHVLEITKFKLVRPYLMYNGHVDRKMYLEVVVGQSFVTKIREAVACDISLKNTVTYIDELGLVQELAQLFGDSELKIPVFVMLLFLEFLCYRRIDSTLSQRALDELQVLVQYGQEPYVLKSNREISLHILGICQQMTRNI